MPNKILEWAVEGMFELTPNIVNPKIYGCDCVKDRVPLYFQGKYENLKVRKRFPRTALRNEKRVLDSFEILKNLVKTKGDEKYLNERRKGFYEHLIYIYGDFASRKILNNLDWTLSLIKEFKQFKRKTSSRKNEILQAFEYSLGFESFKHDFSLERNIKLIEKNADAIKTQALRFKKRGDYYRRLVNPSSQTSYK